MTQAEKQPLKLRVAIIILAALLLVSAGVLLARYIMYLTPAKATASVPGNHVSAAAEGGNSSKNVQVKPESGGGKTEQTALVPIDTNLKSSNNKEAKSEAGASVSLELNKQNPDASAAFEVLDMLPGDSTTKLFSIKVLHTEQVELFFKAKISEQTKELANVLNLKATYINTGKVLFDKPISEIDGSEFSVILEKGSSADNAEFEIEASLDTAVANQYQGAYLKADFEWYAKDGLVSPPMGDTTDIILWSVMALSALALIVVAILMRKRPKNGAGAGRTGLLKSIGAIIVLAAGLSVTTFALVYSTVAANSNLFKTAELEINLNDSKPIIEQDEFLFEPGMTVKKDFFVQNNSTVDLYYKLYFENINGKLAQLINITVKDGDSELYSGALSSFTKDNVKAAPDLLKANEKRDLTITFYLAGDIENEAMDQVLSFDMSALAVQAKNNPDRLFA